MSKEEKNARMLNDDPNDMILLYGGHCPGSETTKRFVRHAKCIMLSIIHHH